MHTTAFLEEEEEEEKSTIVEEEEKSKVVVEEEAATRNWLDLPQDVMSLIFTKLGPVEILLSAQSVCPPWRNLSKEPHLFRSIDMQNQSPIFNGANIDLEQLVHQLVDRSCGQLVEFSIGSFVTKALLHYIVDHSNSLKCLRLYDCYQVPSQRLIDALKKVPFLEELELCRCPFSKEGMEQIGRTCSQLKCLRLNHQNYMYRRIENDEEIFAIAGSMPQLHRLHLCGNNLTNNGLLAILDGCPYLEYLELRQCFNIDLSGELLNKCVERIKYFQHHNDPTDDTCISGYGDGELCFWITASDEEDEDIWKDRHMPDYYEDDDDDNLW